MFLLLQAACCLVDRKPGLPVSETWGFVALGKSTKLQDPENHRLLKQWAFVDFLKQLAQKGLPFMVPFGGEETSSNGSMSLLAARNRKEATALHLAAERGLGTRGGYTKL